MDIETLKNLGIDVATLQERIVEQAVEALLFHKDTDEDGNEFVSSTRLKEETRKRVETLIEGKLNLAFERHIVPKFDSIMENMVFTPTNRWGERQGEPKSLIEYLEHRCTRYMTEEVNLNGESKDETDRSYDWRAHGPRLTVMMRRYIGETLEKYAKAAVTDVNSKLADLMTNAARDAIAKVAAGAKVAITA